jgi:hypothetical protein
MDRVRTSKDSHLPDKARKGYNLIEESELDE